MLLGDLGASSGVAWTLMHSDDTHATQLTTADLLKVVSLDCQVQLAVWDLMHMQHETTTCKLTDALELQCKQYAQEQHAMQAQEPASVRPESALILRGVLQLS